MNKKLNQFLISAQQFEKTLHEHTQSLLHTDHQLRAQIEPRKAIAADIYTQSLQELRRDSGVMNALTELDRQNLQSVQIKLRQAVADNQDALLKAKVVAEKIGEVIIKAARRAAKKQQSDYSNLARQMPLRKISKAVSIDERL